MKRFIFFLFLLLPQPALALSCVYQTPESAKEEYPVAVHGKVVSSEVAEDAKAGGMVRQIRQVGMEVEHFHGLTGENHTVDFREAVTIYDGGSRFRVGGEYVVFLRQDEEGFLNFPICGYAFSPPQSGVEWEDTQQVLGWE